MPFNPNKDSTKFAVWLKEQIEDGCYADSHIGNIIRNALADEKLIVTTNFVKTYFRESYVDTKIFHMDSDGNLSPGEKYNSVVSND